MKRILIALSLLLFADVAFGQTQISAYVYNAGTSSWQPLTASSGTAVQFIPSTAAQLYGQLASGAWTPCLTTGNCGTGGGSTGTVTSVAMTVPGVIFTSPVSGSPITTSGTLALAQLRRLQIPSWLARQAAQQQRPRSGQP